MGCKKYNQIIFIIKKINMQNLENTKALEIERNGAGRNPKALNPFFIEAVEKVLEDPSDGSIPLVLLTNEAILIEANALLPDDQKASQTAFSYAMKQIKGNDKPLNPEIMLYVKKFQEVYKRALIRQERALLQNLQEDENKRQKRARILERKFSEWNLKHISEHKETTTVEHKYNINIIQPALAKGVDILEGVEVIDSDQIEPLADQTKPSRPVFASSPSWSDQLTSVWY